MHDTFQKDRRQEALFSLAFSGQISYHHREMTTPLSSPPSPAVRPARGTSYFVQIVAAVAFLVATFFVAFTPNDLLPQTAAVEPTPYTILTAQPFLATASPQAPQRIGIVAGHWSKNATIPDPGAVCANGMTEQQVNLEIATRVQALLVAQGYPVDVLQEFDPQLTAYRALALVSIHADSCEYINDQATGFKVAAALSNPHPEQSNQLVACLQDRYGKETGLPIHPGSVTRDMTEYHAFSEIHNLTPAAIIEVGFLNLDYQLLTTQQERVAQGVADGILCYLHHEPLDSPTPTLAPATPVPAELVPTVVP